VGWQGRDIPFVLSAEKRGMARTVVLTARYARYTLGIIPILVDAVKMQPTQPGIGCPNRIGTRNGIVSGPPTISKYDGIRLGSGTPGPTPFWARNCRYEFPGR